jgi:lipoprotein
MITKTLRFTLLALTATVVFSSCKGKNDTPTPTSNIKHAERKDIIGKVEQITYYRYDENGQVISSEVVTFDRQLRFLTTVQSKFKNGKFVPSFDDYYTYDSEGHLILHKYSEVGFPGEEKRYTYHEGLLVKYEEYSESSGHNRKTVLYTNDRGKRVSSSTIEYIGGASEKTETYSLFTYKEGKEIETIYSDKARTKIVGTVATIYDDLGRIIQQEARGIDLFRYGGSHKYHEYAEAKYGVFGEILLELTKSYDEKGAVTGSQLNQTTYTRYNAQGLPIEGIESGREEQNKFTIEYKFFK